MTMLCLVCAFLKEEKTNNHQTNQTNEVDINVAQRAIVHRGLLLYIDFHRIVSVPDSVHKVNKKFD